MSDRFRDPLDAWYDEASALLNEDAVEARWPSPEQLPARTGMPSVAWGTVMHVVVVAVICGAALMGRVDPWIVPTVSLAATASLGPRLILSRTGLREPVELAAGLRGETQAQAINAKTWTVSAWALGALALVALVAAGYTYGSYAASSTPFLRLAPLRWSLLTASLVGLCGLACVESWRAKEASTQASALELSLELGDAAEGSNWSERAGARLLLALIAVCGAVGSSHVFVPDNEDDSPGRALVIGPRAVGHAAWIHERFGLEARGLSVDEAWERSAQRFSGQAGELETLTHLADLEGVGFVFIDLAAFPIDLGEREDIELVTSLTTDPGFAVLTTGDVNTLSYAGGWSSVGRTRSSWAPVGPHWASTGAAESWMHGEGMHRDAADHLALARALFAQPAFRQPPDIDEVGDPPQLNGRSHTLLRGVVYFGLHADFWYEAVSAYEGMEAAVAEGRIPPELEP
ncbi:MAG: hypothetical protein K0V04_16265 [Deltaproteobacteria bacterium]|nr:hypothetical protein [Deltaproteobacteria bacterium]